MADKKSLSDFSDRQLLELLLTNQIHIFRELRRLYDKVETGKDKGRGQYWITFKKLLEDNKTILKQSNDYLKNREDYDAKYDPQVNGEG
jgi:hypothetical protein